jgi:hypothetical protein
LVGSVLCLERLFRSHGMSPSPVTTGKLREKEACRENNESWNQLFFFISQSYSIYHKYKLSFDQQLFIWNFYSTVI